MQGVCTCDVPTIDAPGDGRCGDAFSLTVQTDSFSRGVQLTGRLLDPVGGRWDQNTTLLIYGYGHFIPSEANMLTFHSHSEGVRGVAVAVPRLALVFAVIVQANALEVEPAVVLVRLPAGLP